MTFTGFNTTDFEAFQIEGLEPRMQAIRERIQPKFNALATEIIDDIAILAGNEMFLHVAKHARRKVNPPVDTWMSICHNKRGYKQHPHFQVGLFDDRVFIWLAFIYEAPNKREIASRFLKQQQLFKDIPSDYAISTDHMKKDAVSFGACSSKDIKQVLERFRDVKQAELLLGRIIMANDPILADGQAFVQLVLDTFKQLMPLYHIAMEV